MTVSKRGKGFYEITDEAARWVASCAPRGAGLLTVFIEHTSASLLIEENADPDVVFDLERFLSRIAPENSRLYRHTVEGPDDMPAHIRAALTATSLGIPLVDGALALGTWPGIYVVEHRTSPHRRRVSLHLLTG